MTPGKELSSIDFESLIGGPLIAVVHAQAQAAIATVDFIKQVGFKDPDGEQDSKDQKTGEPATVEFKYKKMVPTEDGGEEEKTASLSVPFLSMLPIPNLRIEETTIEFLAKINSVQSRETATQFDVSGDASAKARWAWSSAKLKVSTAYQRKTKEGSTVTRDYSMNVKVKAVQDEMPAGLEKLLGILESNIKETTA